uniref:Uncharacterized protein n=1 Tax=Tanacetum cinerariifolium TaxID=118510 RepID=A0A699GMW9_TANCI|nr:hypothetical protein [Tanacetum cinerariifolium]
MVWLAKCKELKEIFDTYDWVDMMVRYCRRAAAEDRKFGRRINLLREQVIDVFKDMIEFVKEIETVRKMLSLEKAMERIAFEKDLFIDKLLQNIPF